MLSDRLISAMTAAPEGDKDKDRMLRGEGRGTGLTLKQQEFTSKQRQEGIMYNNYMAR
jgi:hypothetical protein